MAVGDICAQLAVLVWPSSLCVKVFLLYNIRGFHFSGLTSFSKKIPGIFAAHIRRMGKVMFSQMFVC